MSILDAYITVGKNKKKVVVPRGYRVVDENKAITNDMIFLNLSNLEWTGIDVSGDDCGLSVFDYVCVLEPFHTSHWGEFNRFASGRLKECCVDEDIQ